MSEDDDEPASFENDETDVKSPSTTTPPCFPKSPVLRPLTQRRPGCRYPELSPEIHFKRSTPSQVLQVKPPGAHPNWGLPLLREKLSSVDTNLKKEVEIDYENQNEIIKIKECDFKMAPHGKTVFDLPDAHPNPPGWWDIYEWRMSHLNYTTSNSEYAKYPPNAYVLPVIYRVKDRSFSKEQSRFPFYRHRSLNTQNC